MDKTWAHPRGIATMTYAPEMAEDAQALYGLDILRFAEFASQRIWREGDGCIRVAVQVSQEDDSMSIKLVRR